MLCLLGGAKGLREGGDGRHPSSLLFAIVADISEIDLPDTAVDPNFKKSVIQRLPINKLHLFFLNVDQKFITNLTKWINSEY